jgi:hypothetical protein
MSIGNRLQNQERGKIGMKIQEIQKIAKKMGINTYRMKKGDIVRAIQRAENNMDCFYTPRVEYCGELLCLWREDCLSLIGGINRET